MFPHERHHHEHGHGDLGFGPWAHIARHRQGFGGRARRGDVQSSILTLLREQDMHGYQIIQELAARSGGTWSPSPGSIYPTLQLLENRGLVASRQEDGKRVFALTDEGKAKAAELPATAPWEGMGGDGPSPGRLREAMGGLASAVMLAYRGGSVARQELVIQVLDDARKRIYEILADSE